MENGTKATVVAITSIVGLVSIFALMADCSKTVATVNAEGARCVAEGGTWRPESTLASSDGGYCKRAAKQ